MRPTQQDYVGGGAPLGQGPECVIELSGAAEQKPGENGLGFFHVFKSLIDRIGTQQTFADTPDSR